MANALLPKSSYPFARWKVYILSLRRTADIIRTVYRKIMENLKDILLRHGFSFKKQFGQNFISDVNLLKSIVALAGVDKDTTVLEIGCGAGTLTRELAAAAKRVVSYEIDKKLQPVLAETLAGVDNAEVVFREPSDDHRRRPPDEGLQLAAEFLCELRKLFRVHLYDI